MFKNYIRNNTYILRSDLARQKKAEDDLKDGLGSDNDFTTTMTSLDRVMSARTSERAIVENKDMIRQKELNKIKPVESINRLLKMHSKTK